MGMATGLSNVTPAGMLVGTGQVAYQLATSLANRGLEDTALVIVKGIADLPENIVNGLTSEDPKVRGETLVNALLIGSVATTVGTRLGIKMLDNVGPLPGSRAAQRGGVNLTNEVPSPKMTREELISSLPAGTKITPEKVIDIRQVPDGRVVWLETGNDAAGLQHIYKRHEEDFISKGIPREEISTVVMNALEEGNIVGKNGTASVYRTVYNGVEQHIAIGIGSNGFVVRANPVSFWK
jgi:filamentous hemagglutinin